MKPSPRKPCLFLGSSKKDLIDFPEEVRADIGYALDLAQQGEEPLSAKALKGFSGRGILEIIENHDGDTYRAVYTVRFLNYVYVLHCFQKKSLRGIATPQREIELIKTRLRMAEADYAERIRKGTSAP